MSSSSGGISSGSSGKLEEAFFKFGLFPEHSVQAISNERRVRADSSDKRTPVLSLDKDGTTFNPVTDLMNIGNHLHSEFFLQERSRVGFVEDACEFRKTEDFTIRDIR